MKAKKNEAELVGGFNWQIKQLVKFSL